MKSYISVRIHRTLSFEVPSDRLTLTTQECFVGGIAAWKRYPIIEDPEVIGRILEHLERHTVAREPRPPVRAPPREAADLFD